MSLPPTSRLQPWFMFFVILQFVGAALIFADRGWRDTAWIGFALTGLGFLLMGRLPEDVRRSTRLTLSEPLGFAASALLITGAVLVWLSLLRR